MHNHPTPVKRSGVPGALGLTVTAAAQEEYLGKRFELLPA